MKKYFGLTGNKLNVSIGFIAGLDFLLFGYDQGVTGGLLKLKSFQKQFPEINPYQFQCPDAPVQAQYDCPEGNVVAYQKYSTYQGMFLKQVFFQEPSDLELAQEWPNTDCYQKPPQSPRTT